MSTMTHSMYRATRFALIGSLAMVLAGGLATAPTGATELKVLEGTPSAEQLENALTPQEHEKAPSPIRFRGIQLGKPAQPSPATQAAAPSATQAPAAKPAPSAMAATANAALGGKPVQAVAAIAIHINFDFNSDKLTPQGRDVLDNLATALKSEKLRASKFMLEGHTDSKGGDAYNLALSERRAQSAREYLIARHGIETARLVVVGKGKSEPLDPVNPADALNRRVQVMNLGS